MGDENRNTLLLKSRKSSKNGYFHFNWNFNYSKGIVWEWESSFIEEPKNQVKIATTAAIEILIMPKKLECIKETKP